MTGVPLGRCSIDGWSRTPPTPLSGCRRPRDPVDLHVDEHGDERWGNGERWDSSRPGRYAAQVEHPILADNNKHRAVMAIASLISLMVTAVVLVVATHGGSAPLAVATTRDTPASTDYAFIQTYSGQPVRHDPCYPLHVQRHVPRQEF